ncbi:hypothetical protein AB8O64_36155 (plasmid) [Streptomyces sp. QH1-20]|uniref:hypothetical protein n=1 Tax=Streptomyces sp. QH1-20 TaxID=3240934 RepID=UPI00351199D2
MLSAKYRDGRSYPHQVALIRPGIAIHAENYAEIYNGFMRNSEGMPDPGSKKYGELEPTEFIAEIDYLLKLIEKTPTGRTLVSLFGEFPTIPNESGGFGSPDHGVNNRAYFGEDARGEDYPIRVLIGPCIDGSPSCASSMFADTRTQEGKNLHKAHCNGLGSSSLVICDPRLWSLCDNRISPPEIVLAHELCHALHALAGAVVRTSASHEMEQIKSDPQFMNLWEDIRKEARRRALDELEIKDGALAMFKVRAAGKYAEYLDKRARWERRQLNRLVCPVPAVEPGEDEAGYLIVGGIEWEEHETHGNPVTLEWRRTLVKRDEDTRLFPPYPELAQAISIAKKTLGKAEKNGNFMKPAVALTCLSARQRVHGITETVIAAEMGFKPRSSYVPLTGCTKMLRPPISRSQVGDTWKGAKEGFQALEELSRLLAKDPPSVALITQQIDCLKSGGIGPNITDIELCTALTDTGARIKASSKPTPFDAGKLAPGLVQPAQELIREAGPNNNPAKPADPSPPSFT